MAAASLSKMPGSLPCLAPVPGSGPLPALGVEEIVSQNRSLKRKSKELDAKLTTLDRVVAQLSNDNLVVHREMESFSDRMELLEKVFMFVNFDELQRVVNKLGKQNVETEAEALSPRNAGACSHKIVDAEIVAANLLEHFSTGSVLTSSSESLHAAAAAAVKSSSTESLHAAAAAVSRPTKSSKKDSKAIPVKPRQEDVVVEVAATTLRSRGQMTMEGPIASGTESGLDGQTGRGTELERPLSRASTREAAGLRRPSGRTSTEDDTLSRPRSKAQALRGVMAAKMDIPAQASTFSEQDFATGTDSISAIRFQPRSKCFGFAQEYRHRNGPDSVLPSFIYERLGQDGMTEDDINNIGRDEGAAGPIV